MRITPIQSASFTFRSPSSLVTAKAARIQPATVTTGDWGAVVLPRRSKKSPITAVATRPGSFLGNLAASAKHIAAASTSSQLGNRSFIVAFLALDHILLRTDEFVYEVDRPEIDIEACFNTLNRLGDRCRDESSLASIERVFARVRS